MCAPFWIMRRWKMASSAPRRAGVSRVTQPSFGGLLVLLYFLRFISEPEGDLLRRDRAGLLQTQERGLRGVQIALAQVGGGADIRDQFLDARWVELAGPRHRRDPSAHLEGGVDAVGRVEKALDESALRARLLLDRDDQFLAVLPALAFERRRPHVGPGRSQHGLQQVVIVRDLVGYADARAVNRLSFDLDLRHTYFLPPFALDLAASFFGAGFDLAVGFLAGVGFFAKAAAAFSKSPRVIGGRTSSSSLSPDDTATKGMSCALSPARTECMILRGSGPGMSVMVISTRVLYQAAGRSAEGFSTGACFRADSTAGATSAPGAGWTYHR